MKANSGMISAMDRDITSIPVARWVNTSGKMVTSTIDYNNRNNFPQNNKVLAKDRERQSQLDPPSHNYLSVCKDNYDDIL
jgi:hypothetical protein